MTSSQGERKGSAGQRLALLVFGAAFVLLFAGFAIFQGIGDPSLPSGAVVLVEDAPDGVDTISEDQVRRGIARGASELGSVPKPGDDAYDELKKKALGELINMTWILGEADERGISISEKEVAEELKKQKSQAFATEADYKKYLRESKFTQDEVDQLIKAGMATERIQKEVTEAAPTPSDDEVKDYYEAAKSSQYTTSESREVRVIKNSDKAKVEAAKAKLEEDDSDTSWKAVAKKYSTDPTKAAGGLQAGVTQGTQPEPLDAAIFAASEGKVEGPVKTAETYTVFEVVKIIPEATQSLDEAKSQISTQLAELAKQEAITQLIAEFGSKWESRTFCAADFTVEQCSNFKAGRSLESNPACFEADPKAPPEACAAPVAQVKPAMPGSVSPLEPEGKKLAQRPNPGDVEEAPAEGAPSAGVIPSTGE